MQSHNTVQNTQRAQQPSSQVMLPGAEVGELPDVVISFINGLEQLESGDKEGIDAIAALYHSDANLYSPALRSKLTGEEGAKRFWQAYINQFASIHSRYSRTVNFGPMAILEWESTGQQAGSDSQFRYAGVTLIKHSDGRITDFRTYFDSAALRNSHRASHSMRAKAS